MKKRLKFTAQEFEKRTGINFENYKKPELFEQIAEFVTFPLYAGKILLNPVKLLLVIILLIAIFGFATDRTTFGIVYLIVGVFFSIETGILWGLTNFTNKLSEDLTETFNLILELSEQILTDINKLHQQTTDSVLKIPSIPDIITGTAYFVVLPGVLRIIKKKIPLVGSVAATVIRRIFDINLVQINLRFSKENQETETVLSELNQQLETKKEEAITKLDTFTNQTINKIEKFKKNIGKILSISARIAALPFKIISRVSLVITIVVSLILYWTLG